MAVMLKRSEMPHGVIYECGYRCCGPLSRRASRSEIRATRRRVRRQDRQRWKNEIHEDY